MRSINSKLSAEQLAQVRAVHAELQSGAGRMPKARLSEAASKCGFDETFLPDPRGLEELSARVSKSVPEDAADDYMLFIDLEDFIALMLALQVMHMRAILESGFKAIDTDGDGYIVGQEIAESMKKEGIELSSEQIAEVVARSDIDGDGKISFDEFVAAVL
eukprot:CAMPEP_0119375314 /NCGR_PEP_ID=MMETSP1334-20130426/35055_1 /TAXON_ID=127549 /ORGANISM="Calcidiscus leptoporus, Strain RCC1130" /LENGTH=160 /DNA_ID=CAMNT_0007393591 /DNA_START=62 /DNA_END=544 /DNA_ORIENTATION=+